MSRLEMIWWALSLSVFVALAFAVGLWIGLTEGYKRGRSAERKSREGVADIRRP